MVALSGLDKVRPPHLTRETLSGRRPADGADTPCGVFRSGENLPGEGDTVVLFSQGGAGENDIRKDVRPREDSS